MLSGYRPYYNGATLSNEYLLQRLQDAGNASLFEQDLNYLSEGLEGRSNNPVALLFDQLFHPDADLGVDSPSALDWKYDRQHYIPHVVLGKTRPGGTWQKMDGTMQTISQSSWMELPNVGFKEWLVSHNRTRSSPVREHNAVAGRATIADVKDYYTDYIRTQGLEKNFRDFHTVTSVQQVYHLRNFVDNESGEVEPCCGNVRRNHPHCWEVRGYSTNSAFPNCALARIRNEESGEEVINRQGFCYVAPHVVLAVGTYDIPNRLGVEGESLSCVVHTLGDFEEGLSSVRLESAGVSNPDPVLVVGAGLSAADAILTAMDAGIPVIHVFRRPPTHASLVFSKLPRAMYPEYHRVHRLMKGQEHSRLYTPMPKQTVMEVRDRAVLVGTDSPNDGASKKRSSCCTTKSLTWVDVSLVVIMVGSRSDLGFLPREGRNLGIVPKWPIDSKHNIIDVDPFSYQANRQPQMFAMGPLVGDNFVRFGIGGALAIVNHFNKCRKKEIL